VPETANTVRELAGQIMAKPMKGHQKALERAVGYVLHELYQGSFEEANKLQALYLH